LEHPPVWPRPRKKAAGLFDPVFLNTVAGSRKSNLGEPFLLIDFDVPEILFGSVLNNHNN
jgi:hypothetical protein